MARGTELAVGYVSLVAETSQLSQGINKALGQAGRDAQQQGTRMGQAMGRGATSGFAFRPQQALAPGIAAAEQTGRQMGQRMGSTTVAQFKQFMTTSGLAATGILGVGAAMGAAMTVAVKSTVDFQTNLNRLQGASRATASEMQAIRDQAQALGNDVNLTGVSAQDAAAAMTELVKGGFSVQQAMDAARGTLQLASAAQIDAANAATIQADALHAFGLQADQAGRMADVLANTANAATGEMTDFAYGFAAGGAVMNQFGVSIEDAATTLGMLANAGIKSSDAGTLVKSMLLAIASPSDQAAGAMADLGLSVWDAQGNFVGMRDVMEQLQNASQRMTPEMYAMATSTAFGSDAARLAGIAAQQGGEGFDFMREAVERQGAAAELAKANTQGLPGVFERLSNTADRAKLSLGALVEGPLTSVGNSINTGINAALDRMEQGGGGGLFGTLVDSAKELAPAIISVAKGVGEVVAGVGGAAWTALATVLKAAAEAGQVLAPVLEGIGGLIGGQTELLTALAAAWAFHRFATPGMTRLNEALSTQAGRVSQLRTNWAGFRDEMRLQQSLAAAQGQSLSQMGAGLAVVEAHSPAINRMSEAYRNAAASAGRLALGMGGGVGAVRTFGTAAGTTAAALSGLKTAAGGVIGALGGPWAAAIAAATVGLTLMAGSSSDAERRANALEDAQGRLTNSYNEMFAALGRNDGNVDSSVVAKATEQVDILQGRLDTLRTGATPGDWLKSIFAPTDADPFKALGDTMAKQGAAENVERIKTAMSDLGQTSQSLGVLVSGSAAAWAEFEERARGAGEGGEALLAELTPLRQEFLLNKTAAENLTPGIVKLQDAIKILGDNTATAEEKTNALKQALDILAGKAPDVQQAQANYDQTMRNTAEATQEAVDATKGFGDALLNADGTVNTATANGGKLFDTLKSIKDATLNVAGAGGDLQAAFRNNTTQFQNLAEQFGLTEQQVRGMAEAMGLIPERIQTLVEVNSDAVVQELTTVKAELEALPPNTPVTINALTEEAQTKLESVGFVVERLPDNKGVKISAPGTAEASNAIQGLLDTMTHIPSELVIKSAYSQLGAFNPGSFASAGDAQRARRGEGYVGSASEGYVQYDPSGQPVQPRAEGGPIFGGMSGKDSVPAMLMPDEHVWTTDEVAAAGGHGAMFQLRQLAKEGKLRGLSTGGQWKDAVPWGVDPNGAAGDRRKPGDRDSAGPFPPWWDMDWWPPDRPNTIHPSPKGGKWWDRSGAPGKSPFKFAPIGKRPGQRKPTPDDPILDSSDPRIKQWAAGVGNAMQFFDEGGPVAPVDPRIAAIDEAYRQAGRPYAFGPWDCSMYMSYIYGAMSGKGPGRYFNTESGAEVFESLGFKRGYKPGALNIGMKHGGEGGGHVSGTLPNGVNVENGPQGMSVYGPGASGATALPDQWYYEGDVSGLDMVSNPTGMPGQGGRGGRPSNEEIQQRIASGSMTQEQGMAMMGMNAVDPAGMAAAGQSGTGDARTEGLIPAGAGNTAPAGSGFIGGLTGLGVQAINAAIDTAAQAGAMGANAFAPGSGAAVQMGAEAAKRLVEYGGEMIGIWGDAAMEIFMPFGTPRWLATNPMSFMPQPRGGTVATTTAEKGEQAAGEMSMGQQGFNAVAGQQTPGQQGFAAVQQQQHMPPGSTPGQPVAPGPPGVGVTPNAASNAIGAAAGAPPADPLGPKLPLPFGIFDQGGVLAPASAAVNLSTQPEMVLTQEQWDSVTAGAARAPLDPAQQSLDFSTHIQSVQVGDVDELTRHLDSRGRLAMMRYGASGRNK